MNATADYENAGKSRAHHRLSGQPPAELLERLIALQCDTFVTTHTMANATRTCCRALVQGCRPKDVHPTCWEQLDSPSIPLGHSLLFSPCTESPPSAKGSARPRMLMGGRGARLLAVAARARGHQVLPGPLAALGQGHHMVHRQVLAHAAVPAQHPLPSAEKFVPAAVLASRHQSLNQRLLFQSPACTCTCCAACVQAAGHPTAYTLQQGLCFQHGGRVEGDA